jgi:hypothetical protein
VNMQAGEFLRDLKPLAADIRHAIEAAA